MPELILILLTVQLAQAAPQADNGAPGAKTSPQVTVTTSIPSLAALSGLGLWLLRRRQPRIGAR